MAKRPEALGLPQPAQHSELLEMWPLDWARGAALTLASEIWAQTHRPPCRSAVGWRSHAHPQGGAELSAHHTPSHLRAARVGGASPDSYFAAGRFRRVVSSRSWIMTHLRRKVCIVCHQTYKASRCRSKNFLAWHTVS